jgi:hypothetical protein
MQNETPSRQTITVGDLCQAIAEGQVQATLHNKQWYQISGRDLRRLASAPRRPSPLVGKRTRPLPPAPANT